MKILGQLFITFFKTGLFTFGGGYAMLPLLKAEVVDKRKWVSENELLDYFSIGQCTPGIIAVNVSTFCGYKMKGITGAVAATSAMILPSLIIITLIASFLGRYIGQPMVAHAFAGIRLGVTALLIKITIDLGKKIWKESSSHQWHGFVFLLSVILLLFGNASAVLIVMLAAVSGFVPGWLRRWRK